MDFLYGSAVFSVTPLSGEIASARFFATDASKSTLDCTSFSFDDKSYRRNAEPCLYASLKKRKSRCLGARKKKTPALSRQGSLYKLSAYLLGQLALSIFTFFTLKVVGAPAAAAPPASSVPEICTEWPTWSASLEVSPAS